MPIGLLHFGDTRLIVRTVTIPLILSVTCVASEQQAGSLRKGLYEERARLKREYTQAWNRNGRTTGPTTESVREAEKAVDREYYTFMQTVAGFYSKGDLGSIGSSCKSVRHDPIASQFCSLVHYLSGEKKGPNRFIASLPRTKQQLEDLWNLDVIVGVYGETPQWPGMPLPDGLVDQYSNELLDLIIRDNAKAIDKYLLLYSDADGGHSEYMQDQLTAVFDKHPELVLRRWSIFRPYRKRLESIAEGISPAESRRIATQLFQLCKPRDSRCEEIAQMFHQPSLPR